MNIRAKSVEQAEVDLHAAICAHATANNMHAANLLLSSFVVVAHWDDAETHAYTLHRSHRGQPPHVVAGLLDLGQDLLGNEDDE